MVHVTDARERALEVRVLVSGEDSGKVFELRAEVREKLIAWLTNFENRRSLPKTRFAGPDERDGGPSMDARRRGHGEPRKLMAAAPPVSEALEARRTAGTLRRA